MRAGKADCVVLLLAAGASLTAADISGYTPLHVASSAAAAAALLEHAPVGLATVALARRTKVSGPGIESGGALH